MDIKKRLELVKRNTAEILSENELELLLNEKKKPVVYWGTAITGKPHIGYLLPALKIADLLKAGFEVKILLADLHGALDNTPWDILEKRYKYYEKLIPLMIEAIAGKASLKNLKIIKGSSFQLKPDYISDVLKISSIISVHDAHKASAEIVKQGENPRLSGLLYPAMQIIDEQYLNTDIQLGGTDQRKIFVLARESLPKIGYKKRIEIMNPLLPGLVGEKMSASDEKSKIEFLDTGPRIYEKIKSADCVAGDANNGLMAFLNHVLMVIKQDKKEKFIIDRPDKYGGKLEYESYDEIKNDFTSEKLHPLDLKNALAEEIIKLLKPIQTSSNKKILEKLEKEGFG